LSGILLLVSLLALTAARALVLTRVGLPEPLPHARALGYLVGGTLVFPLLAVGFAALWRAHRSPRFLLAVANVAMFLSVAFGLGKLALRPPVAKTADTATRPAADATPRLFPRAEWLESCLRSCNRNAARRLPTATPAKRVRYCDVNCACGLEAMTEPAPQPGQVRAPSARWMAMTEQQQREAAAQCTKRSDAALNQE
jgi:hypothetical protein